MAVASVRSKLTMALLEVLGLKDREVVRLSLHIDVEKAITVDVTMLVNEPDSVGPLKELTGRYHLDSAEGD